MFVALLLAITAALAYRIWRLQTRVVAETKGLADIKYALDQSAIVATTDVSGRITYVNDKFCEISKYSRGELIGQDHRIINSAYHDKEFIRNLWRTIAGGQVWHGELRNRAKDGTLYWVETTIVPFLNERGKPYQYTAIRFETTQQKDAEQQLRAQAALARVGQLAAVVAHEVKNPLAGIKGVMQVLMSRRTDQDPEVPVMSDIIARIDTLTALIHDLLLYARPRPLQLNPIELTPLLEDALGALKKDPAIERLDASVTGDARVTLLGDADLLKATFLNLLLNAAQAMNGNGQLRITVTPLDKVCTVEIADNGPGIPPEIRDRIFEPFFTTKTRGGGLGLAIAKRTVELHGGTLSFECPPSGGTVMTVTLPVRSVP